MAKIVVIDDDVTITDIVENFLKKLGHTVISFNSSVKGLNYLNNNSVDILFLDVFMPEKDGYEIIEEIRSKNNKIKIISSSAGIGPMTKEHTLSISSVIGADKVLEKPFEIFELKEVIDQFLQ